MMVPPIGFPVLAACFVVGMIAAASAFVFSRRQTYNNHHENQYTQQNESSPRRARNLTCPFCGLPTVPNDYPLVCGHLCHVTCFRAQPASTRDDCSFCRDDQDEEVIEGVSTSRQNEEIRQRLNRQPPSKINKNHPAVKSSPESKSIETSKVEVDCAFCKVTLIEPPPDDNRRKQLNCGHYAHEKCFKAYRCVVKCQICSCSNDSSNSEDEVECPSHFVANN